MMMMHDDAHVNHESACHREEASRFGKVEQTFQNAFPREALFKGLTV
jgi:hypothetical protein